MQLQRQQVGSGSFRTAPVPRKGKFDYILASCMNYRQDKKQYVWEHIRSHAKPDFTLLAGDTIYLDEKVDVTPEKGVREHRVWFRHKEQRQEKHFREYIRNIPIYSTWNDHDYGKNDADRTQKGKDVSRRAWNQLWANPEYENDGGGVYYSYYWANVHFIVTDDHWDRNPSQQRRFGETQIKWLQQELISSTGVFKVIVVGGDIMQRGYSKDLKNIGKTVTDHKIPGVLFHAGDIHRNEYKQKSIGSFPYPVVQISSSGIAKVWRRPYCHIEIDTSLENPTVTASFYGAATNDMTNNREWIHEPQTRCHAIGPLGTNRTAEHACTETIYLSDLQP